jgi:hypothetical protein
MDERRAASERRIIDAIKEAQKEIITEWMNEKFALFGRYTLNGFLIILFSLFVHFLLSAYGSQTVDAVVKAALESKAH